MGKANFYFRNSQTYNQFIIQDFNYLEPMSPTFRRPQIVDIGPGLKPLYAFGDVQYQYGQVITAEKLYHVANFIISQTEKIVENKTKNLVTKQDLQKLVTKAEFNQLKSQTKANFMKLEQKIEEKVATKDDLKKLENKLQPIIEWVNKQIEKQKKMQLQKQRIKNQSFYPKMKSQSFVATGNKLSLQSKNKKNKNDSLPKLASQNQAMLSQSVFYSNLKTKQIKKGNYQYTYISPKK